MSSLLGIFATAILPIVAVSGIGFVIGRVKDIDADPLNTVVVYVFVPALIFHSLVVSTFDTATLLRVGAGVVLYLLAMIVVAEVLGRVLGEDEPLLSAFVLVSAFPNSGNYGIPISTFAFGDIGRGTAVVYLAAQSVLVYTLGVFVASRSGGTSPLTGLRHVLRIPLVYAVIAAFAVRALGLVPNSNSTVMSTIGLLGDAAIPLMLIILGIQLARTDYGAVLSQAGTANVLKMIVAPVVAVGVALLVGFGNGDVARVFVLECAMPAAVTPLILVLEFGGGDVGGVSVAEYVSTVVMTTTLVSIPLLTILIALLRSGFVF